MFIRAGAIHETSVKWQLSQREVYVHELNIPLKLVKFNWLLDGRLGWIPPSSVKRKPWISFESS